MRAAKVLLVVCLAAGALAAASVSVTPGWARGEESRSNAADERSPGCSSYEKAPDGSWRQIPCVPIGETAAPPRRRGNDNSQASTRN